MTVTIHKTQSCFLQPDMHSSLSTAASSKKNNKQTEQKRLTVPDQTRPGLLGATLLHCWPKTKLCYAMRRAGPPTVRTQGSSFIQYTKQSKLNQ